MVVYVSIYVGLCAYEGEGQRRMLGALIYLSISYYFETRHLNEPAAKLATNKSNCFFSLHPHIVLGLQTCTTMLFYMGSWDLNSVTYACAKQNLNH